MTSIQTTPLATLTATVTVSPAAPEPAMPDAVAEQLADQQLSVFLHGYPGSRTPPTKVRASRARSARIDATGLVTLRHQGRLYHIGIGRPHAGTRVLLLVQDLHIRVITPPPANSSKENTATLTRVHGVLDVLRHHMVAGVGFEPT